MRILSTYATSAAASAAALIVSMAATTPSFGQGYGNSAASRFTGSPYYAGSSYYAGSRHVGSRYYGGSRYLGSRSTAAYGSVNDPRYSVPNRRYAYGNWNEPMQRSDPDERIGGALRASDHNNDD